MAFPTRRTDGDLCDQRLDEADETVALDVLAKRRTVWSVWTWPALHGGGMNRVREKMDLIGWDDDPTKTVVIAPLKVMMERAARTAKDQPVLSVFGAVAIPRVI